VDIDFEKLIHLQHIDEEIQKTTLFLENIPSQIEDIDGKIKTSSQAVTKAKQELAQNQKKRRDLEAEVQDIKPQISKYKRQLNEVKTNKEYSSLLKEIEESQKKVEALEEEIINEMLAADDIEVEIREVTQKADEAEGKFSKDKDGLFQEKKQMEGKRKKLLQEREGIIPQIPSEQTTLYTKIFHKKNSIALSPVRDEFCSMCHMRIRPQVLNELKEENKIILCENCGRILYWKKKA